MNLSKLALTIVPALCLPVSCFAQISKNGAGYILRAKYTKGQVIRFQTVSGVDSNDKTISAMRVRVPVKLQVLDVKRGVATVKLTMGAVVVGGQTFQPEQSTVFALDNRNQGNNTSASIGTNLPLKPVKAGTPWTSVMPVNMFGQISKLEGKYRFAGLKQVNGHLVGVITYELSGPAEGTGTMMILASDGTMYSNDTRLTMGGNKLTRIHSSVTRG
ncbi:MAG: hypothetical protein P4L46_17725 [Fimbriimonas sp.]|nr:hypothetical protein [Fimbriimonas sp.]